MTDWEQLREVGHQVSPPAYESLAATAAKRDRRTRTIAVGGTLLVLLGAGVGLGALDLDDDREIEPAEDPSPGLLPYEAIPLPAPDVGDDHATLAPGRYRVPLDDTLSFDVDFPTESYAHDDGTFLATGPVVLKVVIADESYGVPEDPCTDQDLEPVGPGIDAVARAIREKAVYNASRPEPTALGGASGTYLEVEVPRTFDASRCSDGDVRSPGIPASSVTWAPPSRGAYWILDVDGRRVVVAQECTCPETAFRRAAEVAQSITFTPTP